MRMGGVVEGFAAVVALVPCANRPVFNSKVVEDGLTLGADQLVSSSECVVASYLAAFQMLVEITARNVVTEAFRAEIAGA